MFALVVIRLRRNFTFATLSFLSGIAESTIRQLVHEWLPFVSEAPYDEFVVLSPKALEEHTPEAYKQHDDLKYIIGLLDCTYIYIQKSSMFNFQVRPCLCVCDWVLNERFYLCS